LGGGILPGFLIREIPSQSISVKLPSQIVPANVDVQEDPVAVAVLFANQIIELLADGSKCIGQSLLDIHSIHGDVEGGDPCVRELVDDIRAEQPRVGGKVDPEVFLG
jgi:hypothetical protein